MEQSYATFLTSTGFASVALAIISICRPGDEILVTDAVYAPTRMITSKFLKEFKIKAHFYNPDEFKSLQNKVNKKTKMIFVENPGSNTFEFQDLNKIIKLKSYFILMKFLPQVDIGPLYPVIKFMQIMALY